MELKPDVYKTIKRLNHQKNYDLLKNKLRFWIISKELTVLELIHLVNERVITVHCGILYRLGLMIAGAKEGLSPDPELAFQLYLAAADHGHPGANGHVAQFYYDGRAPQGKNLDLARRYCLKAIELGADKHMLMSEILSDRCDYRETVKYLRKIIESRHPDPKRKNEARKLEINCLERQLELAFRRAIQVDEPGNGSAKRVSSSRSPSPSGRGTLTSPSPKQNNSISFNSPIVTLRKNNGYDIYQHRLPGWFYITEELEGFDVNACTGKNRLALKRSKNFCLTLPKRP